MAREVGARTRSAFAFESTYGVAPASGYRFIPFAKNDLGRSQPLLDNEMLGYGRDPLTPIKDAVDANGSLTIPLDVENLGLWLKAAFGAPTTTGTTPKVHTFQSGGYVLPSFSLEKQMPAVPLFEMVSGCMVDEISFDFQRKGLLTAEVKVLAQGAADAASTGAGTPTELAYQRFGNFNGAIKRNGADLGNILSGSVMYRNNLDPVETIRADGKIDGIDPGMATASGSLVARLADTTLIDQAGAGTGCSLEFSYSLGANASLLLTFHDVYLPIPKKVIEGPQGLQVTFDWQGAKATSPARMCTAVLTNTVATY
jgi:hypothetical protein